MKIDKKVKKLWEEKNERIDKLAGEELIK